MVVRVAILALLALSAAGDVFYWQGGNSFAEYDETSNWKMLSSNGELVAADRIPGVADRIWTGGSSYSGIYRIGRFDMDGGSHTVDGYSAGASITNWKDYWIDVTNGMLTINHCGYAYCVTNGAGYVGHRYTIWNGGTLVLPDLVSSSISPAASGLNETWTVKSGGRLELYARLQPQGGGTDYKVSAIEPGGTMIFKSPVFGTGVYNGGGVSIENSGTFIAENGFLWNVLGYYTGGNSTGEDKLRLRQLAGTMLLGGDFAKTKANDTRPGRMMFELSGGTLIVTNSVRFYTAEVAKTLNNKQFYPQQVYAEMPDGASATVDVKVDSSIDMSLFTYGENTSLVKTGVGRMTIGETYPATLTVNAGSLFLGSAGIADLAGVTMAEGTTLGFAVPGIALDDIPGASSIRFTIPEDFPANGKVFSSTNALLLQTVLANFDMPPELSDYTLVVQDASLILVNSTINQFIVSGEYDLNDPTHWTDGSVPANGAAVINGSGTIGVLSDETPGFSSITVQGGAVLKITAENIELPAITLDTDARLVLCGGTWASLSNGLSCVCSADSLPVFEICTNATLAVPAMMEFKNVDLRHYGRIDVGTHATTANNYIAFGTARTSGEVCHFAMTSIGGSVYLPVDTDRIERFVYAENNGRVRVRGPILLKDMTNVVKGNRASPWFGFGNPTNEMFSVIIDNTDIAIRRTCSWGGGCVLRFTNGSRLYNPSTHPGYSIGFHLQNMVQLSFENGAGFQHARAMDKPEFKAGYKGTPVITLGDGGWFDSHETRGNTNGVLVASNGVWCVDALPIIPYDKAPYPADGDVLNWITDPFAGLAHVRIVSGASLYLASANRLGLSAQQDRFAKLANVPIVGEGGLIVSNGVPGYGFSAVMVSGENTATGRLKVLPADDPTTFVFNDGANWAGTVEGNAGVAFTNLTDAAAPAAVSFGALDLTGDFPVRYWKSGLGLTNDTIALGAALTGTGRICPVAAAGEPNAGEQMTLGTYPASAGTPDNALIEKHWRFLVTATEDPETVLLGCRYTPIGVSITIR